jgi:hypothetical protein
MTVSNITPAADSTLAYSQTFSFEVTAGYTSLLVRVTTEGGVVESVYDTGSGGVAAGYTVTVEDLGATHRLTCGRDSGWSIDPTTVYVTEDVTTTTSWAYDIFPTAEYPEGMQPYNALGGTGTGVTSWNSREGAVLPALSDYDASEVDNDSTVTGATVKDALETLEAAIPATPVSSVFGRTGAVTAAVSDYDASQVDNDSSVAGATVKAALDQLDLDRANLKASEIVLDHVLSAPTYDSVDDAIDVMGGVSSVNGGGIISDDGDGTITVSAGQGFIRNADSDVAHLWSFDWASTPITPTDQDMTYIYAEYNGGSPRVIGTITKRTDFNTNLFLGNVYRNGTTLHITNHKNPSGNISSRLTLRFTEVDGVVRSSGLIISESGTRNVACTAGSAWHGLDEETITGVDTAVADTFTYYYRDGVGGWTEVAAQTQIDNLQYDDGSGTLATLSANRYGAHWIYRGIDNDLYVVYGRGDYTAAQWGESERPADVPPHFEEQHTIFIGRIIIQKSAAVFTAIQNPFVDVFSVASVTDHGDLAGLTDDDHPQYALSLDDAITGVDTIDNDVNIPVANPLIFRNNAVAVIPLTVVTTSGSANALSVEGDTAGELPLRLYDGTSYAWVGPTTFKMKESADPLLATGAGYGSWMVKNTAPTQPVFEDDTEQQIALGQRPGMRYEYDSTTTPGSIATGTVRWNNATQSLATKIYLHYTDKDGMLNQYTLNQLEAGCSVRITKEADALQSYTAYFSAVNDAQIGEGPSYVELDIWTDANSTAWTNMADGEIIYIDFQAAGANRQAVGIEDTSSLIAETDQNGRAHLWSGTGVYSSITDYAVKENGKDLIYTDSSGDDINISWYAKNLPLLLGADMAFRNVYETNVFTGGTIKTTSDANLSWIWDPLINRWYHSYIDVSLGDACITDSADGITWNTRKVFDTSTTSGDMSWPCTDGTTLAIACDSLVYRSTDGTAANLAYYSNVPTSTESTMMFWSEANQLWVHVGYTGTYNYIHTSPDLLTWTQRASYIISTYGTLVAGDIVRDRDNPFSDGRICLWSDTYSDNCTTWSLDTSAQPTTGLQVCHYCPSLNANSTASQAGGWLGTDLEGDVWVGVNSAGTTMYETTYNCGTIWKAPEFQGWCNNVATTTNTSCYGIHAHTDSAADAQMYSLVGYLRAGFSMLHSSKSATNRAVYRWGNGVVNWDRYIDAESMHGRYGPIKL